MVEIVVRLDEDQAEAFAEFLKRVDPDDYKRRAGDAAEANHMWNAGLRIRDALAAQGYAPR